MLLAAKVPWGSQWMGLCLLFYETRAAPRTGMAPNARLGRIGTSSPIVGRRTGHSAHPRYHRPPCREGPPCSQGEVRVCLVYITLNPPVKVRCAPPASCHATRSTHRTTFQHTCHRTAWWTHALSATKSWHPASTSCMTKAAHFSRKKACSAESDTLEASRSVTLTCGAT